jgi:hypothetical protein
VQSVFGDFRLCQRLLGVDETETVECRVHLFYSLQRILYNLNRRDLPGKVATNQVGGGGIAKIVIYHVKLDSR